MNTRGDFLDQLREPYRSQLIHNVILLDPLPYDEWRLKSCSKLHSLLMSGITWASTKEGDDYWVSVYKTAIDNPQALLKIDIDSLGSIHVDELGV